MRSKYLMLSIGAGCAITVFAAIWISGILRVSRAGTMDDGSVRLNRTESGEESVTAIHNTACPTSLQINIFSEIVAFSSDNVAAITCMFVGEPQNNRIVCYEIASDLSYTVVPLPTIYGQCWLARDLDGDGGIELVVQRGNGVDGFLDILSSPSWGLRKRFTFPGKNVYMFPVAVKVDADTLEEVFLTPHYSDGPTDAIVIDYNSDSNNFVIASAVSLTYSFGGRPAVADFDYDGRVEFISGGIDGYGLLEWRDGQLNYIGRLETDQADRHFATVTRPFPGGAPHALLSYMGATGLGYIYKLMQATGDNQFQMAHTFQEVTGFRGGETCWSDDVDCDGFDEIVMSFIPEFKVFEWSVEGDSFTADCTWHMDTVGAILLYWYSADLNWNGVKEWCTVGADGVLRVYPDPDCIGCDSTGACTVIPWSCNCDCSADPQCDGQITVLDVVATVDVAFRGIPAASDPDENCPFKRADVDCSSSISVVDVVKLVNVAFRQADPGYWFCDPCP